MARGRVRDSGFAFRVKGGTLGLMETPLLLHEEVLLLALSDEKGTIKGATWYQQMIGGAVLAELLLSGRVELVKERKKTWLEVRDATPLGEPLIDEWLATMAAAKKRRQLPDWLGRIARTKDLKGRVARRLADRGILAVKADKVLGVFNRERYPEADGGPERAVRARLEAAIFGEANEVDVRTVVLLSLIRQGDWLNAMFGRKALKPRKARIEALIAGDSVGEALKATVQAIVAMAVIASTTVVITAS